MKPDNPWRQVRRFSLRKLSIGLVSATIGLALIGGSHSEPVAHANDSQAQIQPGQTTITYDYVSYEDLTADQRAVLRDSKEFPKEIARKGTNYLLVYRKDTGLLSLPETGDQSGLYGLLAGLGVMAVLVAVTKRNKKLSTKVLIITAISGAALSAANSQALESGLRSFLTEHHLVTLGQPLPQPQDRIGERSFVYYLPQLSDEQASSTAQTQADGPAVSKDPAQPSLSAEPSEPAQPTLPAEPSEPAQPSLPAEPSEPAQPTLPAEPSEPSQPSLPAEPSEPAQPSLPAEPSDPSQPSLPAEPSEPSQPTLPAEPVVTERLISLPFVTEYREDPSLPLGTEVLVQAGVAGQKRLIFTDGVLTGEEILSASQSEIIARGSYVAPPVVTTPEEPTIPSQPEQPTPTVPTKPVDPTLPTPPAEPTPTVPVVETSVVDEPIAFSTEILDAPDLPVGTRQVVQEGQTGIRRVTYVNGVAVSSQIIQLPISEIIRVGSRQEPEQPTLPTEPSQPEDPTLPTGPSQPEDPTLPTGPSQPEDPTLPTEPSQPEEPTLPTEPSQPEEPTLPTEPSQPEEPTLPTEPSQPEQPTLPTEPSQPEQQVEGTEVVTTTVPVTTSEVVYEDSDQLYEGETEAISPAVPGEKTIETTYKTLDGKRTDEVVGTPVETVTTQPIPAKVRRGTKPVEGTETETFTEPLPFTTRYEDTEDLYEDEEETVTVGKAGQKTVTVTYQTIKGVRQDNPVREEVILAAIEEVIRRGTRPIEGTVEVKTTKVLTRDDIVYVNSQDLYDGEEEIISQAVAGEATVTTTYKTVRGEQTDEVIGTPVETITVEPKAKVVKRGTKSVEGTVDVTTKVPVTTDQVTYEDSAELYQGDEVTVSEAVAGEATVTTTYKTVRGEQTDEVIGTPVETITVEPKAKVVKRGTKSVEGTVEVTTKVPVTTDQVTYEDSAELYQGDEVTVSEAVAGEKTIVTTYKTVRGEQTNEVVGTPIETVTTQPQPKVVKRGTRPIEGTVDVTTKVPVTTDQVTYDDSAELYQGEEVTVSEAVAGEKTIVTTYKTVRGERTEEVVGTPVETITTRPQPKVVKRGTKVRTHADTGNPQAVRQTVKRNAILDARDSIRQDSAENMTDFAWKNNVAPDTSQANDNLEAIVTVTYQDGSTEDITVPITVQPWQADIGNPQAVRQTVKRNATLDARNSIRQDSAENMIDFAWKNNVAPDISQANDNLEAVVTVTYQDGSSEDITVPITVQPWQADTGNPQAVHQTVKRNATLDARDSIRQDSADNMAEFAWKNGQPDTSQANDNLEAIVTVTYQDGSTEDITVPITVQPWQADTGNPQAVRQTVKRNATLDARNSIRQDSADNMAEFSWKNGQPDTSQANDNLEAVVTVTYQDGSSEDITVPITVQPWQADTGNPQAVRQTVKRNATLDARDSIRQDSADNMAEFAWRNGQPDTSQANDNLEAIVTVTYQDGSTEDITVPITVQPWQADTGNPQAVRQTVKRNATLDARDSIRQDSAENMTDFAWKNNVAPDTSQANDNLEAIVTVTYQDGSTEDITVPITVQPWQADTGNPQAVRQTVKRNATLDARDSIRQDSADNMAEFSWKNGQPDTSQANDNLEAIVTVTYQDGSTEDITVPITVQPWQADTGNPQAVRQTVKRNATLDARDSIRQDSADNMAEFAWRNGQPDTSQANDNLEAIVTVTYQDGSTEDITVPITVQPWQADTGNPQAVRQTVKRNATLDARDSIRQDSAENMTDFAWKNNVAPDTSQANDNLEAVVTVTYQDGSTEDITVPITVQPWQADTGNPQAVRQTVKRNATLDARDSIRQDSADNMAEFSWKNGQPDTSQANDSLEAVVTVTYQDGSSEDITVPITVQPWQADTGNPQAVHQTVKRNATLDARDSIRQDSAENMTGFAWKNGQPDTSQANDNLEAVVTVTYQDGSTEDITVPITVQPWQADTGNPQAVRQTVKRNATLDARNSIRQDSAENMTDFAWKNNVAPNTSQANDNLEAVVTVTYQDGSSEDITVSITVQPWQADTGNPQAVRQTVKRNATLDARDSIRQDSADNMAEFSWRNGQPDTSQANDNLEAIVTVTYQDGSSEDITVSITVQAWQADTGNPQAVHQTVKRNATLQARDSIRQDSAENMTDFAWKNNVAPDTSQANDNLEAVVTVTYQDGSTEDITVPITVQPWQADTGNPQAVRQTVKRNATLDARNSIRQDSADNMAEFAWKNVQPDTSQANDNLEAVVTVTYQDGSTEDITVPITVQPWQADTGNPQAVRQTVKRNATLQARDSIKQDSADNMAEFSWKNGQPDTSQANDNLEAIVTVTYQDGSSEDITVPITVQPWQADTGNPQAVRQTVKRNATLDARNSIRQDSADNMAEFAWKNGQPDTSQANDNLEAIVTVTYQDGSTEDITVPITVQPWQADTGNPQAVRQTVKRNATLDARNSIRQDSAENMTDFAWKNGQPDTSQANDNLEAIVTVTYQDGSSEDITVPITVQPWQADTGNPQAVHQTVKRNATLDARDSIKQDSAENMTGFAWKNGQPDTSQANENLEAVVTVTYQDGSTEDITVPITVQPWQADTGNPQAVRQTVKRNATLQARDSIRQDSAENMTDFAWKNGQPDTSQANDNLEAVVTVTYQDGSTEDITVPITVQPWQADTGNPQAVRQTVKRNATLDARDSIKQDSAENMTDFAWKNGQPDTSQANDNLEAVVTVTYQDGSTEDITVPITVQPWQADLTEPSPVVQNLKVGDVPVASASISQENLPEGTDLTWAENGTPSTEQVGDNIEGRVRVTYKDGSTDIVTVQIKVTARETIAQQTNPEALKQRVAVGTTDLNPAASIKTSSVARVKTTEWLTQPSTEQAGLAKAGKVRITYEDDSHDDLDVLVDVVTKPTLSLINLVDNDEAQTATLTYRLENPSSTYTSAKVRLLKGSEVIREVDLEQWQSTEQSLLLNNLEHNVEYTVETVLTYDLGLGQGQQHDTLTDRRKFELLIKKVEFRNVLENELYTVDDAGQLTRVNGLTTAPGQTDLANYVVKIRTSKNKDVYLPVSSITDSGDGFTVTASHPELVQFGNDNTSKTDGHSFKLTKIVTSQNAYSDFATLIQAITNNPAGDYFLAADMEATASTGTPYITVPFTGKLASVAGNNRFAIKGLRGPLFSDMNGTVSNIALTGVNINNTSLREVGALAKNANNASISDVEVQGSLIVNSYVGGLVYKTTGTTTVNHVTTDVTISTQFSGASHPMGGIIGLQQAGSLTNSKSTVNMRARLTPGGLPVGGLVGEVYGTVNNSYTSGAISVTRPTAYAGGAFGNFRGTADNVISAVTVTNGNGFTGFRTPFSQVTNSATVTGSTNQAGIPTLSPEEATNRSANWGARPAASVNSTTATDPATTVGTTPTTPAVFSWMSLSKAKASYETAYENMEKLLPYYDRHTIVKYANKLSTDSKLYKTKLLSAVPMNGTDFITNTIGETAINRLFLHFADNSKEEYDLTTVGNFKETDIKEFSFGDGLLYTPEQFNQVPETLINDLVAELTNTPRLTRDLLINLLAIQDENRNGLIINKNTLANRLLYLNKPLEQVKAQLTDHVKALISSYASIDLGSQALARYLKHDITKDKQILMLALAHLERSYNVNYDAYNIKDLVTYRPDFDGKKVDLLSYLTGFAKDEPTLRLTNNVQTYANQIKGVTTVRPDLIDFLEHRRALFLPTTSNDDWFKNNTKAYVYEKEPAQVATNTHRLYSKLKDHEEVGALSLKLEKAYQRFILPLLNLTKEDQIFVLSDMSTLTFGHFGQVVDPALATSNPEQFAAKIREAKEHLIPNYMTEVGNFLEVWYRLAKEDKKQVLLDKQIRIRQGYNILDSNGNKRWVAEHGDPFGIVDDFYGPMELYYERVNQVSARARDTAPDIEFHGSDLLANSDTTTHELVHQYDNDIMLHGYGMRLGQDKESYAKGLFESAAGLNDYYYGFNFAYNLPNANHNSTPDRFKTTADLQHYMKGVFDVTYSLDLLELEAIRRQGVADQHLFFQKLDAVAGRPTSHNNMTYTHAYDRLKPITQTDWATVGTATVDNLIDNNLVLKDPIYTIPATGRVYAEVQDDNYNVSYLTAPIYGGNVNANGTSRGIQFRRTALELLASKGWEEGFLPYATNKWLTEAETSGQALSDQYILNRVLNGQSYTDFKKAEYATRQAQLDQLKGVTVNYNGNRVITTTDDLRALFEEATRQDLDNLKRGRPAQNRHLLKLAIIKAYNQLTNDFSESIYKP